MNNETTLERPTLTPEVVKSKLQICLSKAEQSIQALHDAESELVYNEDNLEAIALFLKNAKAAKKLVDDERVRLKQPSLQEGRAIDAGAKLVDTELDAVIAKANLPYQKLCREVERKRQEAEAEKQRVNGIKKAIDDFFIEQSVAVANAATPEEIVRIEKLVGSHKANKSRYAEFLPQMAEKAALLADLIKTKKTALRELDALKTAENSAEDDQSILDLRERQEVVEATIHQAQIEVQEASLKMATQSVETPEVIIPIIPKGGRKYYEWSIVDERAALKMGWAKEVVVPIEEMIEKFLDENKNRVVDESGIVVGGIRFYIKKKY